MPDQPDYGSLEEAAEAAQHCTRCDLYCHATQTVWGEGSPDARLMIVGEQPGDQEDLQGRPFVGPAGDILAEAMERAGLPREKVWVTNAVKHFKFTVKTTARGGKRRLHQNPDRPEIDACHWWLGIEQRFIQPKLTLALGGTAAYALTGRKEGITKRRGKVEETETGSVLLSWHPSYILRVPNREAADRARAQLLDDLKLAAELVA